MRAGAANLPRHAHPLPNHTDFPETNQSKEQSHEKRFSQPADARDCRGSDGAVYSHDLRRGRLRSGHALGRRPPFAALQQEPQLSGESRRHELFRHDQGAHPVAAGGAGRKRGAEGSDGPHQRFVSVRAEQGAGGGRKLAAAEAPGRSALRPVPARDAGRRGAGGGELL